MRQTLVPSAPNPSQSSEIVLFSNGQYFWFDTFWESRKPSGSSNGHLQSEMCTSHTLQPVLMQDYGTWPSERTVCNAGTVFHMTGVILGGATTRNGFITTGWRKVSRTAGYGEWTPPFYAWITFGNSHACLLCHSVYHDIVILIMKRKFAIEFCFTFTIIISLYSCIVSVKRSEKKRCVPV